MKEYLNILFSVIIPVYNKKNCVGQTLDSVLNQSFRNFEVIVVDDGSTDNSLEVVNKYQNSGVKIIQKENGGVSSARNMGIKFARGQYIALLDADDLWHEDYLKATADAIVAYPNLEIVCANYTMNRSDFFISKNTGDVEISLCRNYYRKSFFRPYAHTSATVLRKTVFKELCFRDEFTQYGEELDLFMEVFKKAGFIINITNVLVYYNLEAESRVTHLVQKAANRYWAYYIEVFKSKSFWEFLYKLNIIAGVVLLFMKFKNFRALLSLIKVQSHVMPLLLPLIIVRIVKSIVMKKIHSTID